jgi:hypothetical protein
VMDVLLLPVGLVFGAVRKLFGLDKKDERERRPADPDAVRTGPTPELPTGGWSVPPPADD